TMGEKMSVKRLPKNQSGCQRAQSRPPDEEICAAWFLIGTLNRALNEVDPEGDYRAGSRVVCTRGQLLEQHVVGQLIRLLKHVELPAQRWAAQSRQAREAA